MRIKDGDWELFDHDPRSGRTVWRLFDGAATHYRTDYPVDKILQDNAAAKSDMSGKGWGEGQRVASIPLNVYFDKLAEATRQGDQNYISKWLNDSDNAGFRTFEGRV